MVTYLASRRLGQLLGTATEDRAPTVDSLAAVSRAEQGALAVFTGVIDGAGVDAAWLPGACMHAHARADAL